MPQGRLDYTMILRCMILCAAVLIVLTIFPYVPRPTIQPKVFLYEMFAFLLTVAMFAGSWLVKDRIRTVPEVFIPFAILLAWALLATILSSHRGCGLFEATHLLSLFLVFLAAAHAFRTPEQLLRLVATVCVAVAVASLYGLAQYAGLDPFPWETGARVSLKEAPATFGNPNFASHAMLFAIVLAIAAARSRPHRWLLCLVPVYAAHMCITQTRGTLVALTVAALVAGVAVLVRRAGASRLRAVAVTLVIAFAAAALLAASLLTVLRLHSGTWIPKDRTLTYRYHSSFAACRMIRDKPLLGGGLGSFAVDSPAYWTELQKDRFAQARTTSVHVHNEILEFGVETGIPGALGYLALVAGAICAALFAYFRAPQPAHRWLALGLASSFAGFLVDGCFGFNFRVPVSGLFFCLFAGGIAGLEPGPENQPASGPARCHAWKLAVWPVALIPLIAGWCEFLSYIEQQRGVVSFTARGDSAAALTHLHRASLLHPYDWLNPHTVGEVLFHGGRYDDAVTQYERALALNPGYWPARLRLGDALVMSASNAAPEAARAILERARRLAESGIAFCPRFPEPQIQLAQIMFLEQTRGIGQHPGESGAQSGWQAVLDQIETALFLAKEDQPSLHRVAAHAYAELGRLAEALAARAEYAALLGKSGRIREAAAECEAILQSSQLPDDIRTRVQRLHDVLTGQTLYTEQN